MNAPPYAQAYGAAPDPAEPRQIRVMSPLLASQIAAGEVVERPASVVKELIENSLDAGSTRISVELEQGGIELIRVIDDGSGVPEHELHLALTAHATSKIGDVGDLDAIATMGFRGEALAAIASVSRTSFRSRPRTQVAAAEISAEGQTLSPPRPAGGPPGTSVTVRTLFFNTPARRKFLRTPQTEQGRCADVVRSIAMAQPNVAFTLNCDGRTLLDLPPNQTPRERALDILGRELEPELIEISADALDTLGTGGGTVGAAGASPIALWGLVGTPAIARATAAGQFVYINGRPVRDKVLQHALKEGYRGLIEPGRQPTCVLLVEMDPGAVDVNVHPAKSEVRFRDSSVVHGLVLRSVRRGLATADLTPRVAGAGSTEGASWNNRASGSAFDASPAPLGSPASPALFRPAPARTIDAAAFASAFREVRPAGNASLNFPALRDALAPARQTLPSGDASSVNVPSPSASPAPLTDTPATAASLPTVPSTGAAAVPPAVGTNQTDAPEIEESLSPALQVFNSYLITQDEHGVLIIDQHALHERVMYERLLARIVGRDQRGEPGAAGVLERQAFLAPVPVAVTQRQREAAERLRPTLERLGIELDDLGPGGMGVRAFTSLLLERGVEPGEFVADMLERAAEEGWGTEGKAPNAMPQPSPIDALVGERAVVEAVLHEVLDMMACKAAVKAGERLSDMELAELLALRQRIERSSNCPHGRPTSIRLSIRELEKRFGRV